MSSTARAKALPPLGLASHEDRAVLNLAVYGFAALVCGVSPVAACAVLLGWAAIKLRKSALTEGRPVARLGGSTVQTLILTALLLGAGLSALAMAPELPRYSSPIVIEVLPPVAG